MRPRAIAGKAIEYLVIAAFCAALAAAGASWIGTNANQVIVQIEAALQQGR